MKVRHRSNQAKAAWPLGARRFATAGVAVVALLTSVIVARGGGAIASSCSGEVTQEGAWTVVHAPHFASGSPVITSYTVEPADPNGLFVTNGMVVMTSTDGGCNWKQTFDASKVGLQSPRVTNIAIAASNPSRVYLGLVEQTQVPRPHVFASVDGGDSFQQADGVNVNASPSPLPTPSLPTRPNPPATPTPGQLQHNLATADGTPLALQVAPSEATRVYFLVRGTTVSVEPAGSQNPTGTTLYVSDNGGDTWTGHGLNTPFDDLRVDPLNANELWGYGDSGLWHSTDGGVTFNQPQLAVIGVDAVDVFHAAGPARILAFYSSNAGGLLSRDDMKTPAQAFSIPHGHPARSACHGTSPLQIAMATDPTVLYQQNSAKLIDLQPPTPMVDLQCPVSSGGLMTIYGRTATTLERMVAPKVPPAKGYHLPKPPTYISTSVGPLHAATPAKKPTIDPANARIVLTAGKSKVVNYKLNLPGFRYVDLFFLVDTTDSMQPEINGVRAAIQQIVNALAQTGIDAQFGLGEYKAWNQPALPYLRLDNIGPAGPTLQGHLNGLKAGGGPYTQKELSLPALYELASGTTISAGADYLASQPTHFRAGALRLVLNGTDTSFETQNDGPGNPGDPTPEVAAAALNAVQAHQIGIAYEDGSSLIGGDPYPDLADMARKTGALAPAGGADCGIGGVIAPGQPMVCKIPGLNASDASMITAAIVNMVNAIPDPQNVNLSISAPPGIAVGSPLSFGTVDLSKPWVKRFSVTYTCPVFSSGRKTYPVKIHATAGALPLTTTTTDLVCKAPAAPVALLPPAPTVVAFFLPPLPSTAQAPNPNPQPQPNPQSQPQQQPQPAAQAGIAYQEEQAPSFAYAYTNNAPAPQAERASAGGGGGGGGNGGGGENYQMSAYQNGDDGSSPAIPLGVGAAAMSAAYVLAQQRRRKARAAVRYAWVVPRRRR